MKVLKEKRKGDSTAVQNFEVETNFSPNTGGGAHQEDSIFPSF
jgi:hypothetical protein